MTVDEDFFAERGFGNEIGYGERLAIVTVDFMKAFTDPEHPLGGDYSVQLGHANRVLDAAHEAVLPVFHTIVEYEDPDLLDAGLWRIKQSGSWRLRAGTPDVELDERLRTATGDQIIVKKYASAFFGTDLLSRLVSRRVDTLIIMGCTTSGCVRATAVDALQNGLCPIVVQDAVRDRSHRAHEQALFDLNQKYADVRSSVDVIARLAEGGN